MKQRKKLALESRTELNFGSFFEREGKIFLGRGVGLDQIVRLDPQLDEEETVQAATALLEDRVIQRAQTGWSGKYRNRVLYDVENRLMYVAVNGIFKARVARESILSPNLALERVADLSTSLSEIRGDVFEPSLAEFEPSGNMLVKSGSFLYCTLPGDRLSRNKYVFVVDINTGEEKKFGVGTVLNLVADESQAYAISLMRSGWFVTTFKGNRVVSQRKLDQAEFLTARDYCAADSQVLYVLSAFDFSTLKVFCTYTGTQIGKIDLSKDFGLPNVLSQIGARIDWEKVKEEGTFVSTVKRCIAQMNEMALNYDLGAAENRVYLLAGRENKGELLEFQAYDMTILK